MSDAGQPGGDFQVTPEEDRFLRAFFRRQAGRYLLVLGALAIASLAAAVFLSRSGPVPSRAPSRMDAHASDVRAREAIEGLRSELAELRAAQEELAALAAGGSAAEPELGERLAALERRVATAFGRIERVETMAREARTRPAAAANANAATASEGDTESIASVRARLYNLETRQETEESQRESFQTALLERMKELEESRSWLASERAKIDRSVLERLDGLEQRTFDLERGLATAPAAPAP